MRYFNFWVTDDKDKTHKYHSIEASSYGESLEIMKEKFKKEHPSRNIKGFNCFERKGE